MRRTVLSIAISAVLMLLITGLTAAEVPTREYYDRLRNSLTLGLKGGFIGFTDTDEVDNTFDIGVAVGKSFIPNTRFELSVDYWSKSQDEGDEFFSTEWSYRDIALGFTALYYPELVWRSCLFPEDGFIRPYLGAGGGIHLIKWEWKSASTYDTFFDENYSEGESDSEFGFHGVGGVEVDINRQWSAGTEFRYTSVHDLDHWGVFARINYKFEF